MTEVTEHKTHDVISTQTSPTLVLIQPSCQASLFYYGTAIAMLKTLLTQLPGTSGGLHLLPHALPSFHQANEFYLRFFVQIIQLMVYAMLSVSFLMH
jgi:hypothetical protein